MRVVVLGVRCWVLDAKCVVLGGYYYEFMISRFQIELLIKRSLGGLLPNIFLDGFILSVLLIIVRVESQESRVESQESRVKSRESRVGSQESGVKSQESEGRKPRPGKCFLENWDLGFFW
jgi:hypothetical protein